MISCFKVGDLESQGGLGVRRATLTLLFAVILSTACSLDIAPPQKLQFVDDTLFLLVGGSNIVGEVISTRWGRNDRLFFSKDHGRRWDELQVPFLSDFIFVDTRRGILLIDGTLFRTLDGGRSRQKIDGPDSPIYRIQRAGSAVAALSKEAVLLSYDLGQTWNRILPPLQPATDSSPSFVATGRDLVAVADWRGRVYTGDLKGGDWKEWIVG